jgi:hypothetical protein
MTDAATARLRMMETILDIVPHVKLDSVGFFAESTVPSAAKAGALE